MSFQPSPRAGLWESRDFWGPALRRQWKVAVLGAGIFLLFVGLHFHVSTLGRIGFWLAVIAVIASERGRWVLVNLYRVARATLLPWGRR